MKKEKIQIPAGTRFLNEVKEFELPNGILNKQVTGCGATTLALTDKHPTIICSPRNQLIQNKHSQYPDSLLVIEGVYTPEIEEYLNSHEIPKILVSFDSFHKLNDLIPDKSTWRVVVDEFHYILQDASFKSLTQLKLLNHLKSYPYVTYLSATPFLDSYVDKIDLLKNVNYYKLEWEDCEKIYVKRIKTNRPLEAANKIISNYLNGNYPIIFDSDKNKHESKECVFYLNSVNDIVKLIKHNNLSNEDVNIIVGNSDSNDKKLAVLGKKFKKGTIPLKDMPHKMFTFCTSTAYAGCDFYSECASTFVISDCRKINLALDISTDLVQIAGRQRLDSNPFRKYINLFFTTNKATEDLTDYQIELKNKIELTNEEVIHKNNSKQELRKKYIKDIQSLQRIQNFTESYIYFDEEKGMFAINELAYLSELNSFRIQKEVYENGISVRKNLEEAGFNLSQKQYWEKYELQIKALSGLNLFVDLIKDYCDVKESGLFGSNQMAKNIINSRPEVADYYDKLGAKRIKALNYKESNLRKEIDVNSRIERCKLYMQNDIKIGDFISAKDAQELITKAYKMNKINSNVKGSDLSNWFKIKATTNKKGSMRKSVSGYKIIDTL